MWEGTYSSTYVSVPTLTSQSSFTSSVTRSPDPAVTQGGILLDCMMLSLLGVHKRVPVCE